MKFIYWNARGLANEGTRLVLKNYRVTHKLDLTLLSDPWMEFDKFPASFWKNLGLKQFAFNDRAHFNPNLWCLCSNVVSPTVLLSSRQFCAFSL